MTRLRRWWPVALIAVSALVLFASLVVLLDLKLGTVGEWVAALALIGVGVEVWREREARSRERETQARSVWVQIIHPLELVPDEEVGGSTLAPSWIEVHNTSDRPINDVIVSTLHSFREEPPKWVVTLSWQLWRNLSNEVSSRPVEAKDDLHWVMAKTEPLFLAPKSMLTVTIKTKQEVIHSGFVVTFGDVYGLEWTLDWRNRLSPGRRLPVTDDSR